MAQIATVRRFNGSSDEIQLDATDYNGVAIAGFTALAIVKRATDVGNLSVVSVSGGAGGEFTFQTSGDDPSLWMEPSTAALNTSYWTTAMGWVLIGVTKADGTTTPRWHRYRYDTQAWDHTNHGSTLADTANPSGASLWLGTYDGSIEFFNGDIAVVGVWNDTALSDGDVESLKDGIAAWDTLTPTGLWLLNQGSVGESVIDRMGAGDQSAINGTSVVAVSDLPFDVGGGVSSNTPKGMTLLGVG